MPGARRARAGYIDWMRGLAVVVMILAHVVDAWTVTGPTRQSRPYFYFMVIAGMGAPLFLWLAGLAVPLAAHARMRRGATLAEASWTLQKRGWQIFGLAMLFRLQAYVFSAGATLYGMFKVDILNIMGLSLVAAGWCWGRSRTRAGRVALATAATIAVLVLSPLLRVWAWPAMVPDPLEWYLRPPPARSTFTLFPWSAFVFAGLALGEWLAAVVERGPRPLPRGLPHRWRRARGRPRTSCRSSRPWLPGSKFWTTSPAFFGIRLGAMIATFGVLYFLLQPGGPVVAPDAPARLEPDGTARAHVALRVLGARGTGVRPAVAAPPQGTVVQRRAGRLCRLHGRACWRSPC